MKRFLIAMLLLCAPGWATQNLGNFTTGDYLNFWFTTANSSGAAVAPSSAFEAADLKIYNFSNATERTSTSGISMTSPFDSITGLHMVVINLGDNTDPGFYAAGQEYAIVLAPDETVDSQAIVSVVATFSIQRRYATIHDDGITAAKIAASAITSSEAPNLDTTVSSRLATGTVASDVTAILADTATLDTQSELRTLMFGSDTAGATASALTTVAGYLDTEVADILTDTAAWDTANEARTILTGGTSALSTVTTAQVNAEADQALADYDPPTNTEFEARSLPSADYFIVSDYTAPPTIQQIWDKAYADLNVEGSIGELIAGDFLSYLTDAATATQTTIPNLIGAVPDNTWDVTIADHLDAGTTGESLNSVEGGIVTPATVADAVWDEATSAHVAAGSFGLFIQRLSALGAGAIPVYDAEGYSAIEAGVDDLTYKTSLGVGIQATVRAYLTSELNAGYNTPRGTTATKADGTFESPLYLSTGLNYTIVYYATGYVNYSVDITVE